MTLEFWLRFLACTTVAAITVCVACFTWQVLRDALVRDSWLHRRERIPVFAFGIALLCSTLLLATGLYLLATSSGSMS